MAMVQSYYLQEFLKKKLSHLRIHSGNVREEKVSSIFYRVPAADIVEQWERQKAKYELELQEALATQKDLKEKDVSDSCVNGKVDHARRNITLLTLQLKYMDREEDVVMQDHEMMSLFMAPNYID
jgi:hypothetical protein